MLHYTKAGNNPKTIVFIHGNSSSSRYWKTALESNLANSYSLLAIDLPGHGDSVRSTSPETDYTIQGMAKQVVSFLNSQLQDNFILIGHSLGCNIIGEIAPQLKGCVGILLTGPSIIGKNLTAGDVMQENPTITPLFTAEPTSESIGLMLENVGKYMGSTGKTMIREDILKADPAVRTTLFHSIINAEYSDELTAIEVLQVPICVVFGANETVCKINYLDNLGLHLFNDKTILIKEAGHYLQLDQQERMNSIYTVFTEICFSKAR